MGMGEGGISWEYYWRWWEEGTDLKGVGWGSIDRVEEDMDSETEDRGGGEGEMGTRRDIEMKRKSRIYSP